MELLRVNITNDGRLVGNKQERLSLVEEDGNTLDSAKLAESTKFTPIAKEQEPKKNESLNNSTQSYSPPSVYLSAYLDTRSPISISFHKAPTKAFQFCAFSLILYFDSSTLISFSSELKHISSYLNSPKLAT